MKHLSLALLFAWYCSDALGQTITKNSFYLEVHSVSTIGRVDGGSRTALYNLLNAGITFGNEFNLSEHLYLGLEFYYYNNKLVLASEGANRFELHQCLGGNLKPGIRYGRHSSFLILGINGVYLFDKNEMTGNQIDQFDDSIFWGLQQKHQLTQNMSVSMAFIHSAFERKSFYTSSKLTTFSIIKCGLSYSVH